MAVAEPDGALAGGSGPGHADRRYAPIDVPIVAQGGAKLADEVVSAMDVYRAGRTYVSLEKSIDDLRGPFGDSPETTVAEQTAKNSFQK